MNIELNDKNNEYDITKGDITRKDLMELFHVPILLVLQRNI